MTSGKPLINPGAKLHSDQEAKLELSFEYLVAADKLEWITVVSPQSILMSLCLQSMVEELVRIRSGEKDPLKITKCNTKHNKRVQVMVFSKAEKNTFLRYYKKEKGWFDVLMKV